MNGLSIEALLRVEDERVTPRVLKRSAPVEEAAKLTAERLISVDGDEDLVNIISKWRPGNTGTRVIAPAEAGETEVLRSYAIDRWCSAQVVWDSKAGQHRYLLIEPQMSGEEKEAYDSIVEELHRKPRSELSTMKRTGARKRILQKFERLCEERGIPAGLKERMSYYIERDFWGYKKIHGLLMDRHVEDVSCNGYFKPVYVYFPGLESIPTSVTFESEEELDDLAMYLVQKGGKSVSAASPIQDVALPDGSRLNVTLYREVSANGTTFSIRLANRARGAAELLRHGTFSADALAFLWLAVENRCSMAFIGGTASGKTAALNAVSSFIVDRNKVVTIEDTREVRLSSQNWTPLVARESGEAPITEFDLLIAAFRQRPEHVIVGEVRTPESARAAIHGINSGHTVSMTFHADSADSFFNRLTNEPFGISPHIAAGVSLCVSLSMVTMPLGSSEVKVRRCRSIDEVTGVLDGRVRTSPLFEWDPASDAMLIKPERSVVMEKMRMGRGWDEHRLTNEIADRTAVLRWMAVNMICGEDEVRKVIEAFHRDRPRLLERAGKRTAPESTSYGGFSDVP